MRFSQRIGKTPVKELLQINSIDVDLMNGLWNIILSDFFTQFSEVSSRYEESEKSEISRVVWRHFFKKPIDEIDQFDNGYVYVPGFLNYLKNWYFNADWYEVYDLIEFLISYNRDINFTNNCNFILKQEVSAYRIIEDKIVQITSEEEIMAIEDAKSSTSGLNSVNLHLNKALEMLSDRKNPDYRNSIKESISAVEAYCIILTGDSSATLGKALSMVENKHHIHKALKNAFSAIYGYASDSGGIRHALLESDSNIEFEDAKFMLVSCSAFINYLKVKSGA